MMPRNARKEEDARRARVLPGRAGRDDLTHWAPRASSDIGTF
jgi:hypothetical protein